MRKKECADFLGATEVGQVSAVPAPPPPDHIEIGTTAFLRTNLALFSAGFSTFALLYMVQPLLPVFTHAFHVSPAESSLSLSVTTATLAISMLVASALSEAVGRKPVMTASLFASALLALISAAVQRWPELLLVRAVMGVALSGLPAVAMAFVGEEMQPHAIGLAMGLFIGGSGFGGMAGRLLSAILTDFYGWRIAVGSIACLGIVCGVIFAVSLPSSRHFRPRALSLEALLDAYAMHLRDPALPWLLAEAFLLMGGFVTIYNYIGYRLLAPPFSLSQAAVGLIFTVYLVGVFASPWMGDLAARAGRPRIFRAALLIDLAGMLLTLSRQISFVVLGVAVLTFGFFAAHSIASSWVGVRARHAKAQASALYLFLYYLGSSLLGSLGGIFWADWGWSSVVAMTGALLSLALVGAFSLARIQAREESSREAIG
jgi:MFS transporter, YNFM family, putative membrane transport protein